jgi:Lar family restriction alleviation protein
MGKRKDNQTLGRAAEMNSEKELKPCPFCGEEVVIYIDDSANCESNWTLAIICGCGCEMSFFEDREMLVAHWNRRDGKIRAK